MIAALLATAVLAGASPDPKLEEQAWRAVAAEFERVGRRTPVRDEGVTRAARTLAGIALAQNARAAADLVTLTEAVSDAGAHDPSPKAVILKGAPLQAPVKALEGRRDLAGDPASHVGVAVVTQGRTSAVVILFVQRRMTVEAFPRTLPAAGERRSLCGRLDAPFRAPEVYVTVPSGRVEKLPVKGRGRDGSFCTEVAFRAEGRHTLEVLGRGPGGPEVTALFFTDVGGRPDRKDAPLGEEPTDPEVAREEVLRRINALRAAHGVAPVQMDARVNAVAQAYSAQMAKENFFAHVAPDGRAVGERLREAGYGYKSAGENLGMAGGPLAAHFGLEHSPGHRKNLLEKRWTTVGIGLSEATGQDGSRRVLLTQIFVEPLRESGRPLEDAYAVLEAGRRARKLPALRRSEVLERLARDHAQRALEAGVPKAEVRGSNLHERVFEALDEVKGASIDLFVADSPSLVQVSKATAAKGNRLVGVGMVQGDSRQFGAGKYWIVVIYAEPR